MKLCQFGIHCWNLNYIGSLPEKKYLDGKTHWHQCRKCIHCKIKAIPYWWEYWMPFLWKK